MTFLRNGREVGLDEIETLPQPDPGEVHKARKRNARNRQTIKRMLAVPGRNMMSGHSQHRRIRR